MSTITYQNIIVDGFPFTTIREVSIVHNSNEHAKATIVGEIESAKGAEMVKRSDETTGVLVSTTAEGQPQKLFYGAIENISLESEAEYSVLHLALISTSKNLDTQKLNKTFQNTGKTYEEILNEILEGAGTVDLTVTDKPIGKMIMQYNETNWEFIKRMASRFNAPVITNVISEKPLISVGLPSGNNAYELEAVSFNYGMNQNDYNSVSQNFLAEGNSVMREDFSGSTVQSYTYGYLGDKVQFNGGDYRIKGIESHLVDGILTCNYSLSGQSGFVTPVTSNVQCSGRMLLGVVQEVKRDKVKVFFTEIDSSFDSSCNWWFPFSTAYSSSDGSGWYCMPEIGDQVRVFFPSNNEADAFAASVVNVAPLDNPRHKSWRAPGGKQILLTDEGLYIICEHEKVFIDLTQEHGINICSEKDINVFSSANVIIQAENEVQVHAKNEIQIGTSDSYIDIRKESITLGANEVIIN